MIGVSSEEEKKILQRINELSQPTENFQASADFEIISTLSELSARIAHLEKEVFHERKKFFEV